jgi:hypothetical protein
VKQIRKRLTYANVMSSIAVFLVLGGATAFAASKITAKQLQSNSVTTAKIKKNAVTASKIKNNSITTSKVANGAITGAKLNLGTVGTVPNATHAMTADNATHAVTADNAKTVNGLGINKILYRVPASGGPQVVFNGGGLVITANCNSENPIVTATTSKQDSSIYIDVFDSGSTEVSHEIFESGEFDVGVNVDVLAGNGGNNDLSLFEYDAVDGSVVTGTINTDTDGAPGGCRVTGTATVG